MSPQDVKALLELVEMGVEVEIRKLASDTKGDLMTALRAKGLV